MEITAKALVVGGGIAGMTAALAIADHGFEVHLVEKAAELGGNLRMIHRTLEGHAPKDLLQKTLSRVEKHPLIHIYRNANPIACNGQVGHFLTTIQTDDGSLRALDHGVTILATGGVEAGTASYGYGQTDAILTQHELEERLHSAMLNPSDLMSVVMIQCVDSRDNERQYCSRICCASALKNALYLKEQNPQTDIYILYRDVMAYGFLESYYTKARQAGIIFIQYNLNDKPKVAVEEGRTVVSVKDPILGREIIFRPDLLALGTGIVPSASRKIADIFGVELNGDGFFQEAESKWRPVDFMKAGVFMCGIAHSPRFINESIATAEAAAQRGLGIIGRGKLTPGSILAGVRHSLCSLCERCIEVCPYGARWKDEEEERIMVNDLICQGCGSCAAACPNSASVLKGYSDQQMFAVMDAALEMEI
jgi:heterodisulfide reductase subunit A